METARATHCWPAPLQAPHYPFFGLPCGFTVEFILDDDKLTCAWKPSIPDAPNADLLFLSYVMARESVIGFNCDVLRRPIAALDLLNIGPAGIALEAVQ